MRVGANTMAYIASFDIGSSAIKAVLLDQQGGMHHACSQDYAASDDAPGEQSPQLWWDSFNAVLRQWWAQGVLPTSLKALTFSGQMQDMIALDERGEVVRPAVLYMDARAGDQAAEALALLGADQVAQITRNPFNGASVLPKHTSQKRPLCATTPIFPPNAQPSRYPRRHRLAVQTRCGA